MKISKVIVTDLKFDVRVFKEAQTLIENGYNCEVLAYSHEEDRLVNDFTNLFYMKKGNKMVMYAKFFRRLFNHYRDNKPDVIHTHDLGALPIGYFLSKIFSAKLIFDAHELYHVINNYHGLKKLLMKFFVPRVDGLITVNNSLLKIYESEFKAKNGIVISNTPDFKISEAKTNIRRSKLFGVSDLKEDDFLMLFQGYVVPDRGLERILEVMKYLPIEFKLVILGDGNQEYITELKDLAVLNEINKRVYFKGAVPYEKLFSNTSSASMGIYLIENTSLNQYYCLPNKIFEFLAAGLPVLSVDFPEIKNILVSSNVGIVVNPETENRNVAKMIFEFANSNDFVLAKDELRKNRQNYTWGKEQESLIKYYENVVNKL